jgi:hypothetical protein
VGVLDEEGGKRSEFEACRCVCLGVLDVFGPHPDERGAVLGSFVAPPYPFEAMPGRFGAVHDAKGEAPSVVGIARRRVVAMPGSNDGMSRTKGGMLHPFLGMPCPFLPMRCPFLGMPCPFLPMRSPFRSMPCPFLGMPCPFLPMRCPFLPMRCPFLPMRCPFLGMLHAL